MVNKKIVIIGYSGHSYGCIEVSINQDYSIIGYYDLVKKISNPYNLKYLGYEDNIDISYKPFISIGDNIIRKKIYEKLCKKNIVLSTKLIHLNSIISKSSLIKEQTYISAGVTINPQTKIGVGCIINTGSIIEHDCDIGEFSHIAPGAVLCGNVQIGEGSFIGANSVIKQGVRIGKNVIIGAGSVIINNIHDNSKVAGNPSKII
tara:strand:- start:215 stop:826 length:612 start_codon:yes stop_codon:yes gene_type:complete